MVETDRAVAFAMDDILLAGFVAGSRDPSLYVISEFTLSKAEPYGIMMRRDDPAFKALADKATAAFYKSPAGLATYDKWFTKPINKQGLNLNFPQSDAVKTLYRQPNDKAID